MNKTSIEWTDYTWNPVSGCNKNCDYCYARKIAHRFNGSAAFPNGFSPTLHEKRLCEPYELKNTAHIFVCSMGELFMDKHEDWTGEVMDVIRNNRRHTFQLLTKQPQNLIKWSPFPRNCWVGATATDYTLATHAIYYLNKIQAAVKFISFEPIKSICTNIPIRFAESLKWAGLNWVILGQQTPVRIKTTPHINWVRNIVESADIAHISVFLKNNLKPLLVQYKDDNEYAPLWANGGNGTLRQEFPDV